MVSHQRGAVFPYFLLAYLGLSLMVAGGNFYTSHQAKRLKEMELLFVGNQYRQAIESFYQVQKTYPKNVDELINDPRFINRHHLRRPYRDPITGSPDWLILYSEDGKIVGVASSNTKEPVKKSNFSIKNNSFSGSKSYQDWQFIYLPAL